MRTFVLEDIQIYFYFKAWVRQRPDAEAEVFKRCYDALYDDVHTYLQTKLFAKMKILEAIYIRQMLDILDGILMEDGKIVFFIA